MKFLGLLSLILFAQATFADPFQDFFLKHTEYRHSFLKLSLSQRCKRYSRYPQYCKKTAQALIRALDDESTKLEDESYSVVTFRKDLFELLNQPNLLAYLDQIQFLYDYSPDSVSLWDETLKYAGSQKEAIRWIGVLFQDVSPEKVHIQYLKQKEDLSETQIQNTLKLERIIDLFIRRSKNLNHIKSKNYIPSLYPKAVRLDKTNANTGFYHFYVPAYLTLKMIEQGETKSESFFTSFLFNYIYELLTLPKRKLTYFLNDPQKINSNYTLRDIYVAYAGGIFATEKPERLASSDLFMDTLKKLPKASLSDTGFLFLDDVCVARK